MKALTDDVAMDVIGKVVLQGSLDRSLQAEVSNGAVENDRKHDDLAMGSMGIRPHGQQRIASCIWNTHRMTLEHAWNDAEKTGWI